jgi:hypothetical protein
VFEADSSLKFSSSGERKPAFFLVNINCEPESNKSSTKADAHLLATTVLVAETGLLPPAPLSLLSINGIEAIKDGDRGENREFLFSALPCVARIGDTCVDLGDLGDMGDRIEDDLLIEDRGDPIIAIDFLRSSLFSSFS